MRQESYYQGYLKGYWSVSKTVIPFIISCKFLNLFPFFNRPLFFTVQSVPVRFMEMTVLDAFRIFYDRFPSAVGRSTFYSLRPREVKIVAPHETCMCIIHENMDLLLKVGAV